MNKVPIIQDTDLLVETEFYRWLELRRSKGLKDTHFIETIKEYTNYEPRPFKGRTDGTAHRYVFQAFWRNITKA